MAKKRISYFWTKSESIAGLLAELNSIVGTDAKVAWIDKDGATVIDAVSGADLALSGTYSAGDTLACQNVEESVDFGGSSGDYGNNPDRSLLAFIHNSMTFTVLFGFQWDDWGSDDIDVVFSNSGATTGKKGLAFWCDDRSSQNRGNQFIVLLTRSVFGVASDLQAPSGSVNRGPQLGIITAEDGGDTTMYLDGKWEESDTTIATVTGDNQTDNFVGANNATDFSFDGRLGPFIFWDVAVSSGTAALMYEKTTECFDIYDFTGLPTGSLQSLVYNGVQHVAGAPSASLNGTVTLGDELVKGGQQSTNTVASDSNYVEIGDETDFAFLHDGSDYTVVTWARWDDVSGSSVGAVCGTTGGSTATRSGFSILLDDRSASGFDNTLRVFVNDGGSFTQLSFDSYLTGSHCIVAQKSGSVFKVWADGELKDAQDHGAWGASSRDRPYRLHRVDGGGSNLDYDGAIGPNAIYDTVLDSGTIQALTRAWY